VAKRNNVSSAERQQTRDPRVQQMLRRLGARVKLLRRERRLTQEELAERAGLTSKFVGEVERAESNPSAASLARMAGALSVSMGDLFEADPDIVPVPLSTILELHDKFNALGTVLGGLAKPEPEPQSAEEGGGNNSGRAGNRARGNHANHGNHGNHKKS
jgi:transcriptional regulator with XRE-family HTH domain